MTRERARAAAGSTREPHAGDADRAPALLAGLGGERRVELARRRARRGTRASPPGLRVGRSPRRPTGERTGAAVDRDDAIARAEARARRPACRRPPRRPAARRDRRCSPSIAQRSCLPSRRRSARRATARARALAAPSGALDVDATLSAALTRAAGASAGPASSPTGSPSTATTRSPARTPAAAAGVPARRLGEHRALARECRRRTCPRTAATASSRLAIGPAATIAMRLPDALPVERARQVARRRRRLRARRPSSRSRRAESPTAPTRCGRGRSGATRRRGRSRPRSAAP